METLIQTNEIARRRAPVGHEEINPMGIQPGCFAGPVAVPSLLNAAGPAVIPCHPVRGYPAARARWLHKPECAPRMGTFRVLKNAAPFAHRGKRRGKAALVVAL